MDKARSKDLIATASTVQTMSFCDDCFKCVQHKGTYSHRLSGSESSSSVARAHETILGKIEVINGVETYVAIPEGDYAKEKAILFLPDAFGLQLKNNQLLVDDFARNGFATYLPDFFNGDPITDEMRAVPGYSSASWFSRHGPEVTRPPLDAVMKGLKERGITEFGAVGYCFGARYCFDIAFENLIKVCAVAHPSRLEVPADLEKYASTCTAPLLINSCETDPVFPITAQSKADEIFGDGKFKPGYRRTYWDGCVHGYAVRGDMSDPKVKAGKEGTFKASVEWFQKYL